MCSLDTDNRAILLVTITLDPDFYQYKTLHKYLHVLKLVSTQQWITTDGTCGCATCASAEDRCREACDLHTDIVHLWTITFCLRS